MLFFWYAPQANEQESEDDEVEEVEEVAEQNEVEEEPKKKKPNYGRMCYLGRGFIYFGSRWPRTLECNLGPWNFIACS